MIVCRKENGRGVYQDMLEKISYICTIIATLLAIWQYIRAEKYKKLYNQQFSNNTSFAGRDVNNAQGDITVNNDH